MMGTKLSEKDWNILLRRINTQKCIPFLGAGACYGVLPLGKDIASDWVDRYNYPLKKDQDDLIRVAQYLAVEHDLLFPKQALLEEFENGNTPDFRENDEPHGVLAELPLPIYITTNYDKFMVKALSDRYRDPKRETCRWNSLIEDEDSIFDQQPNFIPTPANPVVFHLHGYDELPESLVLTEDDYLMFLTNIARNPGLLPKVIQKEMARSTFLFIGYSLADWNFRVLFQSLRQTMNTMSIAVMLPPDETEPDMEKAQEYMDNYFDALELRIYWGTAREFAGELRERWHDYQNKE